jgi:L-threonylcarbamoyladenylate synthase
MEDKNLILAKELLEKNEVIAIPTETVYGLAGNAYNEIAVKKIFEIKKRPFYNPLIVHIASVVRLDTVAESIPAIAYKLAEMFWPGPLTLILKKKSLIPHWVTGGKDSVAVRVPNHPLTLQLLNTLDFPLAAPSANPFGTISPTQADHVANYFKNKIPLILDGGTCKSGLESTIIGFENDQVILYRHGAISIEAIESITGKLISNTHQDATPIAPGMLSKHYAPNTNTIATSDLKKEMSLYSNRKIGVVAFKELDFEAKNCNVEVLSKNGLLEEAAKNFYAALHRLDKENLELIIIEQLPDYSLGKTINDRIQRAIKK